jgi:hypothetical protein
VSLLSTEKDLPSLSIEQLVEAFASVQSTTRKTLLKDLDQALLETGKDAHEAQEIQASYEIIRVIRRAVYDAEQEFKDLSN